MNCTSFTFADIFSGIGGVRLGFEGAGGTCVFSSETDPAARRTYEENFGDTPWGDIRTADLKTLPDFDILLADFPYALSAVLGEDGLLQAVERILEVKRPEAFFLENGKNLLSHGKGKTFEALKGRLSAMGYTVYSQVLNAWDYGVPQKRERLVTVGFAEPILFAFPERFPAEKRKTLADILEPEDQVKKSYYVSLKIRERKMKKMMERCEKEPERPYITNENVSGMVTPHRYACSLRAGASANYLLVNNERRMTERELFRLQGFPDTYRMPSSFVEVKNLTGNSSVVPMVQAVAERMLSAVELYQGETIGLDRGMAKAALDRFLRRKGQKAWRVIQAGEILYQKRLHPEIRLEDTASYKKESRRWRDDMGKRLLGEAYQAPATGQDSLFYKNALPPEVLQVLGEENNRTKGAVEAYIYRRLTEKERTVDRLLRPWICPEGEESSALSPADLLSGISVPGLETEERRVREAMTSALIRIFGTVLGEAVPETDKAAKTCGRMDAAVGLLTGRDEEDEGFFTAECLGRWYERIFSGACGKIRREPALAFLRSELQSRFPRRQEPWKALADRGYESLRDGFWK